MNTMPALSSLKFALFVFKASYSATHPIMSGGDDGGNKVRATSVSGTPFQSVKNRSSPRLELGRPAVLNILAKANAKTLS